MTLNSLITIWEAMDPPCTIDCANCGEEFEQRREERCCCECRAWRDE